MSPEEVTRFLLEEDLGKFYYVAGGALRDILFDKEVKDIDVFSPRDNESCMPVLSTVYLQLANGGVGVHSHKPRSSIPYIEIVLTSNEEYEREGFVCYRGKGEFDFVNVIYYKDSGWKDRGIKNAAQRKIQEFPITLSQVAKVGNELVMTVGFAADVNQAASDLGTERRIAMYDITYTAAEEYIERIKKKYPEWLIAPTNNFSKQCVIYNHKDHNE